MSITLKMIHRALSDADIRTILGQDVKIIKYSELSGYTDLDQLLPRPVDTVVILYENVLNSGHWCCLSKYNGMYEFFDPYGIRVDNELKWTNLKRRRTLNEAVPYLSNLLRSTEHMYNPVRYQQLEAGVNTCGDHASHRAFRLLNSNMDLGQYHDYMKELRDDYNMSYDQVVAEFCHEMLR